MNEEHYKELFKLLDNVCKNYGYEHIVSVLERHIVTTEDYEQQLFMINVSRKLKTKADEHGKTMVH